MAAGGPSIAVRVLADLKGFATAVSGAGDHVQTTSTRMRGAFSGVTGALNQTGVLGPFSATLDGINSALDSVETHGKNVGVAMMGVGAALTGIGAGLSALGSKDQAAQQQLSQAIDATGQSYDDYSKSIEEAISHQEKYGHTANETQDALRLLTNATHDPQKALDMLGEAADVAASKHEDFSTAATQLGKVYNGNTKLLKEYGIIIDKATGLTKDGQTATEALAKVTGGQAAAAADTFMGKIRGITASVEDQVAQFGTKYGPAIQTAGIGMVALGAAMEVLPALFGALSAAWSVLTAIELTSLLPILAIVAAVAALIAIGYVLYANWDTIWSGIQAVIGAVWDWIAGHWPLLLDILLGPFGIAVYLIIEHFDQIKAAAGAVIDFVVAVFAPVVNIIAGPFQAAVGLVQTAVGWIIGIVDGIGDAIETAMSGLENVIAAPFRIAKDIIMGIIGGIEDAVGKITGPLSTIGGAVGSGLSAIGLQHGGIVTHPTLAIVGEAGPEAVIPLNQLAATGAATGGPAVVINDAHFTSDIDVDLFMQRVSWAVQRQAV